MLKWEFCDEAIGHDSKLIAATIIELWIILERYVKGLCISLLKGINKACFGPAVLHLGKTLGTVLILVLSAVE